MKKGSRIRKNRRHDEAEYSAILSGKECNGLRLEHETLGETELVSGVVCFFDPYDTGSCVPFAARLPAGKYRVFATRVSTETGERVALAGLDGGGLRACTTWKFARCVDNGAYDKRNTAAGTAIESGLGALCGEETFAAFMRLVRAGEDVFHPLDGVVNMDGSFARLCALKDVRLPVFSTGRGEGVYRSYVGFDADGVCQGIVCDFSLLGDDGKHESGQMSESAFDTAGEGCDADTHRTDAEKSIIKYSAVIQKEDASAGELFHAYSRRGYSYHTVGRYVEALADYRKAIELGKRAENAAEFPKHAWSLFDNAALICRETGQIQEAISLYEKAKDISDTFYSGAYAGLIDIYRDSKDYVSALRVADEMVTARPQDPSAYVKRSEIYMESEDYEKAIADLDVLIDTFKLNESVLDKSVCLSNLGRQKEALKVLDSYLLEDRASEVYFCLRAGIHLAENDVAAAYNDVRKAYDINPDYPQALDMLIDLDSQLFNFKNVVKWATRYIDLRPQSEYGYSVRAEAHMRLGAYEEAVTDYLHLTNRKKTNADYYVLLIRAALCGGSKGLAKRYQKALRHIDNASYIGTLGLVYFSEHKYARAQRYLASAFALRETDVILASLLDCFLASGALDKADAAMVRYAEIADSVDVFIRYARIAKARDLPVDNVVAEYIHRQLHDCRDESLLEKVRAFFRNV